MKLRVGKTEKLRPTNGCNNGLWQKEGRRERKEEGREEANGGYVNCFTSGPLDPSLARSSQLAHSHHAIKLPLRIAICRGLFAILCWTFLRVQGCQLIKSKKNNNKAGAHFLASASPNLTSAQYTRLFKFTRLKLYLCKLI